MGKKKNVVHFSGDGKKMKIENREKKEKLIS